MGKRKSKSRKHRPGRMKTPALTPRQEYVKRRADHHGLFVLFEAEAGKSEKWTFFCRAAGREVLTYWPGTEVYVAGGIRDYCKNDDHRLVTIAASHLPRNVGRAGIAN